MDAVTFCNLLQAAQLDQTAAAEKLGTTRRTVYRWLRNRTPISEAKALLIRAKIKPVRKPSK